MRWDGKRGDKVWRHSAQNTQSVIGQVWLPSPLFLLHISFCSDKRAPLILLTIHHPIQRPRLLPILLQPQTLHTPLCVGSLTWAQVSPVDRYPFMESRVLSRATPLSSLPHLRKFPRDAPNASFLSVKAIGSVADGGNLIWGRQLRPAICSPALKKDYSPGLRPCLAAAEGSDSAGWGPFPSFWPG